MNEKTIITREEVEELIERLATAEQAGDNHWENPIMLTDVLEKMSTDMLSDETGICFEYQYLTRQILRIWRKCGFTNSFQGICKASGWEKECMRCGGVAKDGGCQVWGKKYGNHKHWEILKSPEARSLAQFLIELFPKK